MHSGQGPTRTLHSVPLQLNTGTWQSPINFSAAKIEIQCTCTMKHQKGECLDCIGEKNYF